MIRVTHNGEEVEPKELHWRLEDGDVVEMCWVPTFEIDVTVEV